MLLCPFVQHIKVKVAALLNDTVGTQIAAAHDNKTCELGVIVGKISSFRLCLLSFSHY